MWNESEETVYKETGRTIRVTWLAERKEAEHCSTEEFMRKGSGMYVERGRLGYLRMLLVENVLMECFRKLIA